MSNMTSGFGQFHTNEADFIKPNKKLTPYTTIDLAGIRALVDNPQMVDKDKAQWIIPSTLPTRNFRKQEESGKFCLLWADLDKDAVPIADVKECVSCLPSATHQLNNFEIYSSRSATKDKQKGRIIIPLAEPLCFADWVICQEILNDYLENAGISPDRTSQRAAQLCYLPNRGDFYESHSERKGIMFNPNVLWAVEIAAKRKTLADNTANLEVSRQAAAECRKALKISLNVNGRPDTIGAFNSAYSVQEILLKAGYFQHGDTFRHPASESGSYSASVKDGRVHSLSSGDPLYTGGSGIGAHDAFSAFTVLMHSGNRDEALKDAGDNMLMIDGEPYNIVKQREYMHGKVEFEELKELKELPVNGDAIPFDIEYPPGLAGTIAEYIFNSSRMPVRSFAIAGAISALAYLSSNNWYVKSSDTALNLYQVLVGGTGKGKEDPRKAVKRLADSISSSDGICESIASGPALLRTLEIDKNILMLTDEFGLFLQVVLSDKGSMHLKELVKELLTLHGLGRTYFAGKKYANSKMNIPRIYNPFVNVLGTTTQLELMDGVTSKSVDNGFLNRFLLIAASEENPINRNPNIDIPKILIDGLSSMKLLSDAEGISYEEGAEELMVSMAEQMVGSGEYANLWSRAEENMIRVSGLLAIVDGAVIRQAHIMWAHRYVSWCIKSFAASLGSDLAETHFEKKIIKARNFIKNSKHYANDKQFGEYCNQGYMPRGKLAKLMKIPSRELDEVVTHLTSTKQVEGVKHEGGSILFVIS